MAENMGVNSLKSIYYSQASLGIGLSLKLLSRMVFLNARIGLRVEMARCLLQAKDLSTKFWDEVVYYENYFLNWILTRVVCHVTSIKKWCGNKPSIGHLTMFGCVPWEHVSNDCRKKLDEKSHSCIMMRYSEESKDYWLFVPVKQHIIIRNNVIFDENSSDIGFLKSSSGSSYNDPFHII